MDQIHILSFPLSIWKVLLDHQTDYIAIEIRDEIEKQVQFFSFSLSEASASPKQILHPEPWWAGLEACTDGVVLIHGYEDYSLPFHKGLIAYDIKEGNQLWMDPDLRYLYLSEGGICCQHPVFPAKSVVVDLHNGKRFESSQDSPEPRLVEQHRYISFPEAFEIFSPEIEPELGAFSNYTQLSPVKEMARLQNEDISVFYTYTYSGERDFLRHHLCILRKKEISFHRSFISASTKPLLDPFFRYKDFIIWIEGKEQLNWLKI